VSSLSVGIGATYRRTRNARPNSGLAVASDSPFGNSLVPLRMATVCADPDRATREPLRTSLAEIGIGRILEALVVASWTNCVRQVGR